MINQDFAEFPEHRVGFFKLLRAINLTCFPGELRGIHVIVMLTMTSFARAAPVAIQAGHGFGCLGVQAHYAGYCGNWFK
jgi:hypothetical protein